MVKRDGIHSLAHGAVARRLGRACGSLLRTALQTQSEDGSSRRVGCWHLGLSMFNVAQPFSRGGLTLFCSVYYLYAIVRRPRLILDFSLTLLFNHLVLTTYYSSAVPSSLFFWAVVLTGSALTIIFAEQLCVKREMAEGLVVASSVHDVDDIEMGGIRRD